MSERLDDDTLESSSMVETPSVRDEIQSDMTTLDRASWSPGTNPADSSKSPTHEPDEPIVSEKEARNDVASPHPDSGETRQNIIWIASYPKSGNTWVRIFLHNLLREMRGETEGAQNINALHRFTSWEFGVRRYEDVIGKPVGAFAPDDVARARMEVQRRLAMSRKGPALIKTHLAFGTDRGFPTINLSATRAAIYLVRNPLDVAISYAHHTGWSIDRTIDHMAQAAFQMPTTDRSVTETIGSWSQHVASWMGVAQRPVLIMRYEDMVRNALASFSRLATYLRLKPTVSQLSSSIEKSSFVALAEQERQSGFREKPVSAQRFFRDGTVGQWRNALTATQVEAVVSSHVSVMQRLGYMKADIGAPLLSIT